MNRSGFVIALAVSVVVGILFGVYAKLDLDFAGLFFNPNTHMFRVNAQPWVKHSRDASRWLVALLSTPAILTICGKLILPRRRTLMSGRAALFLVLSLALGPGILANEVLKDHWGRSRPIDVTEFGGTDRFTPWWDSRGECPNNCSFIAGEPSGAFWTLAPAALAPPQWRLLAYSAALVFGAANGLLRMAGGAHFFTDVVFAGVFMYLVVWMVHGLIFRWRTNRMGEDTVERTLARRGAAMRNAFAALARRIGWRTGGP
jgi:membrane-associated PAP2 superfamily phosphatase